MADARRGPFQRRIDDYGQAYSDQTSIVGQNSSLDEYVFLMKDERIRRGTQTRIVRRDTVLAPGERIELNVLCSQLPPSAGDKPSSASNTILPPLVPENSQSPYQVERRFDSRHKMVRGAEYPSDNVEPAPKFTPIDEKLEQQCREIVPRIPRGTTGFIFVCDGQSLGADFFGSEDLALKLLPKLLKSYALDHVSGRIARTTVEMGETMWRRPSSSSEYAAPAAKLSVQWALALGCGRTIAAC